MERSFFKRRNKGRQFLISILLVTSIAGICYAVSPYIGYRVVALILLLAVSFIAALFDILPVLVAASLSALIWNFFFIPPYFTFTIRDPEDILMFLMYFVIAIVNGVLTYKLRQMEKESMQKEEKERTLKLYNALFNSLSHELQTPISTIVGASDSLKDDSEKLSEKNKTELVDQISAASLRLNEQVGNLLNMSRLETGHVKLKRDWCDINELIYSVVDTIQKKASGHKIQINIPENFPLFRLDYGIMQQVLHNLLNNAVQYTPDNTAITIDTHYTTSIAGHFENNDSKTPARRDATSHTLVITVSDNGKGFPESEIEKVFDKFYRLHNSQAGGTGLGLSIVKGFVEAHNGKIQLHNLPKGGAEFTLEIPAGISYINSLKHE